MYIQRNKRIYKGKEYTSILLRECYYENGKIKQKTLTNLSKMPDYLIKTIELAIKKQEVSYKLSDLKFEDGYPFGDIACLSLLIKDIGLDDLIYSKPIKERNLILTLIITRILHPSTKLENIRWIKERAKVFSHFYSFNYDKLNIDEIYESLDWLEGRQKRIEKKLLEKMEKSILFLYDITKTHFEGESFAFSDFSYPRRKSKTKRRVIIGLTLNNDGQPLSVRVFKRDIKLKIEDLKKKYFIDKVVFIKDRGMITELEMKDLKFKNIDFITSLTHQEIEELIKGSNSLFHIELFDEKSPIEIEYQDKRYIFYKSEEKKIEERKILESLLWKTRNKFDQIKRQVKNKKLKDIRKIKERIERWGTRYKVGRYFKTDISEGKFNYCLNNEELKLGRKLLGCYVIITSLDKECLSKEKIIDYYENLSLLERSFRLVKMSIFDIHPIYHGKEKRLKSYAFICMLSYYLVIEIKNRLKKLFAKEGKVENYTITFEEMLSLLNQIKVGNMKIKDLSVQQLTPITPLQKKILFLR